MIIGELSNAPSLKEIYRLLIINFLIDLFTKIGQNPFKLFKLNKEEKTLLSYLLVEFLPSVSQNQIKDKISLIQIPIWDIVLPIVGL
ncbi:MAG: hypothetical protein IPO65_18215 [Saprospiraceae bacterium]|nr:hypothetical protein [Saprospiraceae bacterium]